MKIYHYWQDFKPEFKKISKIVTDPDRICDRLSRISYKMFEELFKKFNCEIIVLNKIDNEQEVEKI